MFVPSKVLIRFSDDPKDLWTIDDAVKGVSIIGGTGSGKTTASGKTIAKQYLKQGWGAWSFVPKQMKQTSGDNIVRKRVGKVI